ncbi:MAG: response regulator [Proteobacteria bacterium]|nr:response regulator [Pseudomonadota bacterium]
MESKGFHIYVVDDDAESADALAAVLGTMGHHVMAYYDGVSAWEDAQRVKPDCVLLDIAMEEMDGLALASAMRAKFGDDVVLIAITGVAADDKKVQSTFRLVDHYFVKPIDMSKLEAILLGC